MSYSQIQAWRNNRRNSDVEKVISCRGQVRKPEDINLDDVSPILDVLSEDNIEKFGARVSKNEALKQSQENARLKNELRFLKRLWQKKENARINLERITVRA